MKEKEKIDFVSILQDEELVNRVKNSLASDSEMVNLLDEFSDQKESLLYAIEFIKLCRADSKEINQNDYDRILATTHNHSIAKQRSFVQRLLIVNRLWKAAAIFIVLAATSVVVYQYAKQDSLTKIAQNKVSKAEEAFIILSDGTSHKLGTNDTFIEYSDNGSEVIVKGEKKQEKKLENRGKADELVINQIVVPYGRRHSIRLSDGTQVQLNSGSKLVFPAGFTGNNREVYLEGEGYFEVEKNPAKPFIVKTKFIDIRVLGTVFNVSAYESDQTVSAVLVEGAVKVSQKNKVFNNEVYSVQPGQGCFYSVKNLNATVRKVDLADYILWKDGLFQFHNQPLKDVVERVKKYYNVSVVIVNDKLANTLVTGKLVLTDECEEAMDYLAKTMEAKYEKKDTSIFIIKD